ncbi:MAG: hypothetical protein IPM23_26615 [Candidatus Melainabacteria bacterium]|nr:hypothetical protein [Candidatus Melainabacteria bacterium]
MKLRPASSLLVTAACASAACAWYSSSTPVWSRSDRARLGQLVEQINLSRKEIARRDQLLLEEMRSVRKRLALRIKQLNSLEGARPELLPSTVDDCRYLAAELAGELGSNPFDGVPGGDRLSLVLLSSLSNNDLPALRRNPPSSWQAAPGTINIVHNGYDLAVFWGASADGRPLRNLETGDYRILTLRLTR